MGAVWQRHSIPDTFLGGKMKRFTFGLFAVAALLLVAFAATSADVYPTTIHNNAGTQIDAEDVGQNVEDMIVWVVCVGTGFTYSVDGVDTKLDPSIATITDGVITPASVNESTWPVGQADAMRQWYADRAEEWLRNNYGLAVYRALVAQAGLEEKKPADYGSGM